MAVLTEHVVRYPLSLRCCGAEVRMLIKRERTPHHSRGVVGTRGVTPSLNILQLEGDSKFEDQFVSNKCP